MDRTIGRRLAPGGGRRLTPGGARRLAPVGAALALFVVLAALWLCGRREAYADTLRMWGIHAYAWPFLDTDTVLSAVRCLRRGVDVYAANPCDPLRRAFDYSPLWMTLRVLPVTTAWIPWVGLGFVALFFVGLGLLPAGRTRDATLLVVVGTLSTPVVLAVERGNNDLVIFGLVSLMATCLARDPARRGPGYALGLLAGWLKYYPLLVMAAALREAPARFLAIAVASLVATALVVSVIWPDLTRALAIIPTGSPWYEMFGATNLGLGLVTLFHWPHVLVPLIRAGLTLAALGIGVRLGLRRDTAEALARLDARERAFLLVGALMALGCFLSAQNIIYRTMDLMLVLPSLTALWLVAGPLRLRGAVWLVLGLLWHELYYRWMQVFAAGVGGAWRLPIEVGLGWLPRELAWWCLVAVLASCVTGLLRDAPAWALIARARPTPHRA